MSWTVPAELLVRAMVPSAATGVMTRLGVVWSVVKLRLEVPGVGVPPAWTVMLPKLVGEVAVRPRPVTETRMVAPGATGPLMPPVPERGSSGRKGACDENAPGRLGFA